MLRSCTIPCLSRDDLPREHKRSAIEGIDQRLTSSRSRPLVRPASQISTRFVLELLLREVRASTPHYALLAAHHASTCTYSGRRSKRTSEQCHPMFRMQIMTFRASPSVDALTRLHKKAKSLDTYLDDRSEPSSVRKVWAEIRDGVERGVVFSYKSKWLWLITLT